MPITQTVTVGDLTASIDREIDDLREQYDDAIALIEDRWGEDALDEPLPEDPNDEQTERLAELRMTAAFYEESAKRNQQRKHAIETLAEKFDGDEFEIKMLTGVETMDTEAELRAMARERDVKVQTIRHYRKQLVVDAATVDAPEGFPTDEEGSPKPSAVGNPLTYALYDAVERLNNAGTTDFRAPGFGDEAGPSPPESSGSPNVSKPSSMSSGPTVTEEPHFGTDS